MPKKYFADQMEDEEVLLVFRKHPIVMRKALIIAMLLILAGNLPALIKPEFSWFFGGLAAGFLLAFLCMFPAWIGWYFSLYIVTDQRLIQLSQRGLFHRSVVDLALSQIQMVNYQISGFQETVLGFGTIMIQTYVGDLTIKDVHHPAKIQKELLKILREQGITAQSKPMLQASQQESDEEET